MFSPHPLKEAERQEERQLRGRRQCIPLLERAARSRDVAKRDAREREVPREVDALRLHAEADEGRHRDAAVLDLGRAQEANRRLLRLPPELHLGEARRVVVADRRVQLASQDLEVLNLHEHKILKSGHSSCGRLGSSLLVFDLSGHLSSQPCGCSLPALQARCPH